ncbi:hypothetical protein [Fulvivirga lutea]|uniref:Lipoprotein n=1 Tax=Fulvivirga lutea TaxID=2810512 RepID=A0A974ZZP7_9BACT|nr:hypothetical protein [Fulvivirga lutea]QSE96366.1 hypothetical protein JR347_12190 [Fulvivirga lutea]
MKLTKLNSRRVTLSLSAGILSLLMFSCADDEVGQNQSVSTNVVEADAEMDAVFEDIDDLSSISLEATEANSGGRMEEFEDDRLCEGVFSYEGTKESGTITLDFGDGCVDRKGNVRKGIITISHTGRFFAPGGISVVSFDNYSINDIQVEGTRTIENITESLSDTLMFSVTLKGGKLTWPDESFATREVNRVRVWERALNPLNDKVLVSGTASGVSRGGVAYSGLITEDLVFVRNCRISKRGKLPVEGINVVTTENNIITMYFGDGECDRRVRIVVDGVSDDIVVE